MCDFYVVRHRLLDGTTTIVCDFETMSDAQHRASDLNAIHNTDAYFAISGYASSDELESK